MSLTKEGWYFQGPGIIKQVLLALTTSTRSPLAIAASKIYLAAKLLPDCLLLSICNS